ncbi:MAG TPA: UvrD-helicase domain-containing protein [Candidatus Borkfalkia avistercoris]|uniref:DNA 3'-5' helicase n=1 Tax=Candidatus Borkfalkia avistercoris TaxID=2838504 RepID=A0A9D2D017_9FIRM|nr:UvrD-helicase domain-containing protein [Candidatus Borkfalkia avistercoris]
MENGLLSDLNENQRAAVEETEGYVRVAAGAGSGKTKVLTRRYVYIAKALGVAPEHILSVTFTNKAAWEMRKRIRSYMPDEDGGWILTFHSACHKILKYEIANLAYPSNFMVLDEEDQKTILQRIYTENGLTLRNFPFKKCLDAIEVYKSQSDYVPFLTDPKRETPAPDLPCAEDKKSMHFVILKYLESQRKNFFLDFADLIQFVLYLFEKEPAVLEKWANKFEYIQIDEFQDVSGEQYKLARRLASKHKNLFIVGDPDQTIYSWRGADVRYFNEFPEKFRGAKTILLDTNYRSTPEILAACNSLISRNTDRLDKRLKAAKSGGERPKYRHERSRTAESDFIAEEIGKLHEAGVPLADIAVLYRGNYMSRAVEEALVRKKIPYTIYSGIAFYQRKEIKDALAYLRLCVFGDDLSFLRTVNVPPRGIGKTRLAALQARAEAQGALLLEALRALHAHPLFKSTKAEQFIAAIDEGKAFLQEHDIADALDFILQRSGYTEYMMLCGNQDRLDNLNELKASVRDFVDSAGEEVNAEDYLNGISLISNADAEEKKDCVKLMTVHTAKGLEFKNVFVCCLNEGLFPSRKIRGKEEMEEERRVAYVAMTRAEDRLYLSDAEGFDAHADGALYTSRFLFDIEKDLLDASGSFSEGHLSRSKSYIQKSELDMGCTPAHANIQIFRAGDKVRHPLFGAGTVQELSGGAYTVLFSGGKTRSIAVSADILIPLYEKKA